MAFNRLAIPDLIEIVPPRFSDDRGFFSEVFRRDLLACQGIEVDWFQDNLSVSARPGTMRGLHFQVAPFAQDKLIRVSRGAIYDVAVDIREGSPTYGAWVGCEISAEKWNQLFVPKGFAHGFMTLVPDTEVFYKVSAPYSAAHEGAIRWDDADVGIRWPDAGEVTMSPKDAVAPAFRDHVPTFSL
nr:dTDP-4-dehydrorhamnose 3,5-epimerase [Sphingomonas sp. CBMAI 2297]